MESDENFPSAHGTKCRTRVPRKSESKLHFLFPVDEAAPSPEKGAKLWKKFQNELQLRTSGPCPSPLNPSGDDIEHEQRLRPRRRPIKGADIQMTSACVCVVGVMIRKKTDPPSAAGAAV